MFEVEEHGRHGNDQAGGNQQGCPRRWYTYCQGCAHIRGIARHAFKLSDAVCAQLVAGHRAQ